MEDFSLLRSFCDELRLVFYPQDWGICNGDANRVEEFIDYFNNHKKLEPYCIMGLFELIIASVNEALIEGKLNDNSKTLFDKVVKDIQDNELLKPVLSYWKGLPNNEEFPISSIL